MIPLAIKTENDGILLIDSVNKQVYGHCTKKGLKAQFDVLKNILKGDLR